MKFSEAMHMAQVAEDAIGVIAKLTGIGGAPAQGALLVIGAITKSLQAGFAGEVSPQVALSQIETMHDALKAHDIAAAVYEAEKFGAKP